jgi:thioredoxin-like negative regulator of GroEL
MTTSSSIWSPGAPPVSVADVGACKVLVVHCWADWNPTDRRMEQRLAAVRAEYGDRICFRSCDTDQRQEPFMQGVTNVPALACFVRGEWVETIVGLRPERELRSLLDRWLAAATGVPANPPMQRTGRKGILSFVRRLWAGR